MAQRTSRRVVVVDSPDERFFEQAIFIVRRPVGEGVTSRQLVEEARRVARNYANGHHGRFYRFWRDLNPAVYTLLGAAAVGLAWLTVALV